MSTTNCSDLGYVDGLKVIREEYDESAGLLTRYVEKPVEEVKIVEVPKITYVDVVKQVPDIRIETVEREVEELYIDEVVQEVPVIIEKEVVKNVPVKKVVEVPVEHIREVPVDKVVTREEIVEVPGEIIEVEKHYEVQQPLVIPRYNDTMKPTVYQQLVKPVLRFGGAADPKVDVDVYDYDPVLCKVLVHIPKPVKQPVWNLGAKEHTHKWMTNIKDYDHLVTRVNPHLQQEHLTGLLTGDSFIQPIPDTTIQGYTIMGTSPLPGTFNYSLQTPAQIPAGVPPDPKPIMTATYVNAIAREAGEKREKRNPQFQHAISALKTLRKNKYRDPMYDSYLVQHHKHFADTANVVDKHGNLTARSPTSSTPAKTPDNQIVNVMAPSSTGNQTARAFMPTASPRETDRLTNSDSSKRRSASEVRESPRRRMHASRSLNRDNVQQMAAESPRHKIHSSPRKIRTIRED